MINSRHEACMMMMMMNDTTLTKTQGDRPQDNHTSVQTCLISCTLHHSVCNPCITCQAHPHSHPQPRSTSDNCSFHYILHIRVRRKWRRDRMEVEGQVRSMKILKDLNQFQCLDSHISDVFIFIFFQLFQHRTQVANDGGRTVSSADVSQYMGSGKTNIRDRV